MPRLGGLFSARCMREWGVDIALLCKSGLIILLICLGSPELSPGQERNLGSYASILWEPELQCSKNEWLTYRHFFWCFFFLFFFPPSMYKGSSHFCFFGTFRNGSFWHSVKSSKVRILKVICKPIHLNTQIHFFSLYKVQL